MSDAYSNIDSQYDGSSKYNPKVMERKMKPQTDWAELVRNQQNLAERMIQQENEKRAQQRYELNHDLRSMVNEKQNVRKQEETFSKQQDHIDVAMKRQDYEQYLERSKNEKADIQRALAVEYQRKQQEKDDEKRRKVQQEKQVEQKMIEDALDSLQREKEIKERKRNEFMQSVDQLMQEKEAQKRREQEKYQQDRQENNRLIQDNIISGERKDNNYKMYYQRLNDQQVNLQQTHDQKVTQLSRTRDQRIDDFINKGVEEARVKAEEEERLRQMRKQEQQRSMADNIRQKMHENQEQQTREKLAYQNKIEELHRTNQELQSYNDQAMRYKTNQVNEYKTILQNQMREAEELKRKAESDMLDHERKMNLNQFNGLIPGIRNTKIDPINNYQYRSDPYSNNQAPGVSSPTGVGAGSYAESPGSRGLRASMDGQIRSPPSAKSNYGSGLYNPITNPVPNNIQNPYLVKEYQTGSYNPRNYLAVTASKNLLGTDN